ncbi:MmgE/PrpD family protein [SAR202 cluster bacterium AC-409-J13_OGT_754m]|nr:MmgE/PrpD family protein [SAR202 cluster bacterium AC-409-J13_OGT_754m]
MAYKPEHFIFAYSKETHSNRGGKMSDYLDDLTNFIAEFRYADLSDLTKSSIKKVVMDTIGAMLAGSRLSENKNLAHLVGKTFGPGDCTLIGHSSKVPAIAATFSNATAGVSLEMDEGNRMGGGHPGIHVVPGALSIAEEMNMDGAKFLEAVAVGYEVISRIGGATKPRENVHSHGTWGTIGTAVATSKLMGYSPTRTRNIINLAASMSPANSWSPCFEGATVRNLYPGRSGMQGILAAQLDGCGFTGLYDGPSDVYGTILADEFIPEVVISGIGVDNLRIEQNYFKFHACCLYNHPALDAVYKMWDKDKFTVQDIESIRVVTVPFAQRMAQSYPENILSSKFHVPFAIALFLITGQTDAEAFTTATLSRMDIKELAQRIFIHEDTEMNIRRKDYPLANVSIMFTDGSLIECDTNYIYGDFMNPRTDKELVDKFTSLSQQTIGEQGVSSVIDLIQRLDQLDTIKELTNLLGNHNTTAPY